MCIIAGYPPIDLLAIERKDVYEVRRRANDNTQREIWKAARKKTMIVWQAGWDATEKGRWTHRLIPKLEDWIHRKHGEVNYYLT